MPMPLYSLVSLPNDYGDQPIEDLPVEILRDHLLRALLQLHIWQRDVPPSERLPPARWMKKSTRLGGPHFTLNGQKTHMEATPHTDVADLYGALLVYAITLWRVWRKKHLPCSPGFSLVAPPSLFASQDIEILSWNRTFRVQLAPTGYRPLRERWESAPATAYREPIPPAELLDGLSFIVENELHPLKWRHVLPWTTSHAVRPVSTRAATERRAPRLWLFPLEHGVLDFERIPPRGGRSRTRGFRVRRHEPMTKENRLQLEGELGRIAQLIKANQEIGPSRDIVVFPELCLDADGVAALRKALHEAGANPALVIAGSQHIRPQDPEAPVRAEAPIFCDGEEAPLWCHTKRGPFRVTGKQWKALYPNEAHKLTDSAELWEYITPGNTFTTFDGPGGRMGVLICADLLEERFPAMRDLVRIALVDLLLVVNSSPKTTLFMRHAEQLNRLGVCAVFLNAARAIPKPTPIAAPKADEGIDPFTALVALPQLTQLGDPSPHTWIVWRHTDHTLMAQTKEGWKALPPQSLPQAKREFEATQGSPAALLVDLNAWLADPMNEVTNDDPVMNVLGQAIHAALTGETTPREDRGATLKVAEASALPVIAASIPPETLRLLQEVYAPAQGLFEPIASKHGDTLKKLITLRLARAHRLAVQPKQGNTEGLNAESIFIVSLTPLGDALADWLVHNTPAETPTSKVPSTRMGGAR